MPGGWTIPRDVAKLATARAEFNFEVPFGELPDMPAEWAAATGTIHATLRFARERAVPVVDVAIHGSMPAICQRCLGAMTQLLESSSRVAILANAAQADTVPPEWETMLASDGQLPLAALIAEEVLLSLPVVPRHMGEADCGPLAGASIEPALEAAPVAGAEDTQRPFADLRALLGKEPR